MPWKQWAYLEKVSSADFQQYLQNQTVPTFTSVAQRDSVYTPAPPPTGALCITLDTFTIWVWRGTAWARSSPGLMAEGVLTTLQTGIGAAIVDINNLIVTFTPQVGRLYRVSIQGGQVFNNNAATAAMTVYITDGANNIIASQIYNGANGVVAQWPCAFRTPKLTLPAGTPVTYKGRASMNVGTDMRIGASATAPFTIVAEDIGAQ